MCGLYSAPGFVDFSWDVGVLANILVCLTGETGSKPVHPAILCHAEFVVLEKDAVASNGNLGATPNNLVVFLASVAQLDRAAVS